MWKKLINTFGFSNPKVGDNFEEQEVKEEPPVIVTTRSEAENAASELVTMISSGAAFSFKIASSQTVNSCKNNIKELYLHIATLLEIIEASQIISPADAFGESSPITIKDMMIDGEFYIPNDIIEMYAKSALTLCNKLKESDTVRHGRTAHNARVLTMQLATIRDVSRAFHSCYIH